MEKESIDQLRPRSLNDFIGHVDVRKRLDILASAALLRQEPLGHLLFYGPPGLGKTTLANIMAERMGGRLVITSGPTIEKAGDLAGLLTSLDEGDFLFIDEIHRLSPTIEEYLYPAIEDFKLDLIVDSGTNARSIRMQLNRFTLIGATTRIGALSAPLRSRFHFNCRLDYYPDEELTLLAQRSSAILGCDMDFGAAEEIARRSRGTPRIVNNLVRWVRDVAQTRGEKQVLSVFAKQALDMLAIDERGLDKTDQRLLELIIEQGGAPVGLSTLAAFLGEEAITICEVYEPFLMMRGLLRRTPRGRQVTRLAYEHLKKSPPEGWACEVES